MDTAALVTMGVAAALAVIVIVRAVFPPGRR
jgi:hypothetical protein